MNLSLPDGGAPLSLRPFAPSAAPEVRLTACVSLGRGILQVYFTLAGDLDKIEIPEPAHQPTRRHNLWQATCFEVFLGRQNDPAYWEINLAPAGDWNLYRFSGYRQGMEEDAAIAALPSQIDRQPQVLAISLAIDAAALDLAATPLQLGLAAVLLARDGGVSHWALGHPAGKPDFHDRRGHFQP